MSIDSDLALLELDSQTNVLSRIQFVTRFGSHLVHVEGVQGSGKSWLAQRYLDNWCNDTNQVLLTCHPNQSIQQRRDIILRQVVSAPLFNDVDTLVDSLERMLTDEQCNLVIVIDDADLLSSDLLCELWLLIQKAQSVQNWQINVLLFSKRHELTAALSQMSYGQENKAVDIDIEPLTREEATRFAEVLAIPFAKNKEEERHIRDLANRDNCLPADFIVCDKKKVERRVIIRSVTNSPVGILAIACFLLVATVGTYWWMGNPASTLLSTEALTQGNEQLVIAENDEITTDKDGLLSEHSLENETHPMPRAVIATPVIANSLQYEEERVTVPSEVVDVLVDYTNEPEPKAVTKEDSPAVVELNKPLKLAETSELTAEEPEPEKENIAKSPEAVEQSSPEMPITFSMADKELKAISDKRYILQLAALTNTEATQKFIDEHQIEDQVRIYQTLRNGSIWYIVTFGDYATIALARSAVQMLPSSVQTLGPWVKSLVQVHREIDSVK